MWHALKIFIFVFLWAYLTTDAYPRQRLYTNNLGHRGGVKHFKELPENSLIILEHALKGGPYGKSIQHNADFRYLELDVRETLDGHLVVFHDRYLRKMIPNRGENNKTYRSFLSDPQFMRRTGYRSRYKEFQVQDLTLEEIKRFHLEGFPDQSIPTLEEYLFYARQFGLQKPMAIDIKDISDRAKLHLMAMATAFLKEYLDKIDTIRKHDYEMTSPLVFLASSEIFRNFPQFDEQISYSELSDQNEFIPVFFREKHKGYVLTVGQNLLFLNKENSTTSPDHPEAHAIYQEPLSQCTNALH